MKIDKLLQEFDTALNQEIEHIKKTGGNARFRLRDGKLIDSHKDKFIYEFITETPLDFEDNTPINIKYGNDSVRGSIISINGLRVLLGLSENIGSKIPEIEIIASAYFLLEILKERISDISSKRLSLNRDIAMKTFGFSSGKIGEDTQFLSPFEKMKPVISKEQKEALIKSLGSEASFVWGPPGTGKTTTLSYLINELLLRGKSILLISHTNVAIDNALEITAKRLKARKDVDYFDGRILRIGISPDIKFFDNFPELELEYWVKKKREEIERKLEILRKKLDVENELLFGLSRSFELIVFISAHGEKMRKYQDKLRERINYVGQLNKRVDTAWATIVQTKNKIKEAEDAQFVRRIIAGLNPKKLGKKLEELSRLLDEAKSKLVSASRDVLVQKSKIIEEKRKYTKNKDELNTLLKKLNIAPNKKEIKNKKELQQKSIEEIIQKINTIQEAIQEISSKLLYEAKLIGSTITQAYINQDIYGRMYDVVVVDEGSMASLPALFFDCCLSKSKIIIFGDFRQLSPIALSEDKSVEKWLRRDIFKVSGITRNINEQKKDDRLAILREQRRMPASIAELVNKTVYLKHSLETKEKGGKRKEKEQKVISSVPFSNKEIVLCDTSTFNPWCARSLRKSPFNIYSAYLSVHLAEQALLSGNLKDENDIAILTPYSAQNNLIHKLVSDKEAFDDSFERVRPASIHRFQGRESELVILDLVEGPLRKIKWLNGGFDSDAMRLINVAITRARAKIIFVANLRYLKQKLEKESILLKILRDIEKNHSVVDAQDIFKFIKISTQEDYLKLDNKVPYFYNQAFFYKAFHQDLLSAEDKIIIVSPFISRNRLASLETTFRTANSKKVKIFVITKPFKEQKISQEHGQEIVSNLKSLGVELMLKKLSHEKIAVIDDKIIWHGSLNILSHRNTSELMIRIPTQKKNFSVQALKLCGINVEKITEENIIGERIKELNKRGVGFCACGSPLVIKRGSHGIFLSCSRFPECREKAQQPNLDLIAEIFGKEYIFCEKCGAPMAIRFNRRRMSRFLGCSKYPECCFTRPL
jgi:superfamily I DNA and/or RNA helicase